MTDDRPPAHPLAQFFRTAAGFATALDNTTIGVMKRAGVQAPAETGGQRAARTLRRWADIIDKAGHGEKR